MLHIQNWPAIRLSLGHLDPRLGLGPARWWVRRLLWPRRGRRGHRGRRGRGGRRGRRDHRGCRGRSSCRRTTGTSRGYWVLRPQQLQAAATLRPPMGSNIYIYIYINLFGFLSPCWETIPYLIIMFLNNGHLGLPNPSPFDYRMDLKFLIDGNQQIETSPRAPAKHHGSHR